MFNVLVRMYSVAKQIIKQAKKNSAYLLIEPGFSCILSQPSIAPLLKMLAL